MTKQEALQRWCETVEATAQAWRQEFGEASLEEAWTGTALSDIPHAVIETLGFTDPFRELHVDVAAHLEALAIIDQGMDSRSPYEYNSDMCDAINRELDRLRWSSDTAPEGNTTLDAFPTDAAGIVMLADTQEQTLFYAEPLFRVLCDLQPPISYDEIWHAMLPHMVSEA